jgi:hypothetical protein
MLQIWYALQAELSEMLALLYTYGTNAMRAYAVQTSWGDLTLLYIVV